MNRSATAERRASERRASERCAAAAIHATSDHAAAPRATSDHAAAATRASPEHRSAVEIRAASAPRATSALRAVAAIAVSLAVVLAAPAPAGAAPLTVGLFVPSAPFPSTVARVELARRLGAAIGAALGTPATGRVYARAADFAAAVRRGEVALALVDPAYLAHAGGPPVVLAVALHAGEPSRAWQLVARGAPRLGDLRGKRLLVPSVGGREAELALHVRLGGELGRDHFARIEPAPDTASALAALGLDKADAAMVPAGGELPPGVAPVLALPALSNPVLAAYRPLGAPAREAVLAALAGVTGDATVTGFRPAGAELVTALARRFSPPVKRAPFAVPPARLPVDELVGDRAFAIERTPASAFVIAAPPPAR